MGTAAVYIESYLFPALFLYFVYDKLRFFRLHAPEFGPAFHKLMAGALDVPLEQLAIGAIANFFMVVLDVTIIYGLVVRRNLKRGPQGFQEVFIPLLGTFFYLAYNFVEYLPAPMNALLIPQKFLAVSAIFGTVLNTGGALVSSIATYHLRYSYAVFVQLRDIMTKGLYRWVRHPIYLGYTLSTIGFIFVLPRLSCIIVFLLSFMITVYRAKLEERKLLASPEYQEYARKTPFLFPGFLG
jgi:protein-S-isoprenylcysteine O-methyltransferase Ste14